MSILKNLYKNNLGLLCEKLAYNKKEQVPRLVKVCVNIGMGNIASDSKIANYYFTILRLISGQKPVYTYARKSISGFKIREGEIIGCKVTLRKRRMYEFLEKLIYITLPEERAFKGLSSKQFDNRGNISLSIKEHTSFLEGRYTVEGKVVGMDINIVTSATNNEDAKELLSILKFPFFD